MQSTTLSARRPGRTRTTHSRSSPSAAPKADAGEVDRVAEPIDIHGVRANGDGVCQLVLHYRGQPNPRVDLKANIHGRSPMSFEDRQNDDFVPRLGSSQLLKVADFLRVNGFEVIGFQLADGYMRSVAGNDVSKALVKAMRKHGAMRVGELLATAFEPFVVVAVDFRTPALDSLTLKQNGVILGSELSTLNGREAIKQLLTRAWSQASLR